MKKYILNMQRVAPFFFGEQFDLHSGHLKRIKLENLKARRYLLRCIFKSYAYLLINYNMEYDGFYVPTNKL